MAIKIRQLDHYAIAVNDLARSINFYHDILGLGILPRPNFDFEGAWLDCSNGMSLHLIEQVDTAPIFSSSRHLHFAFAVDDLIATKEILIGAGIDIAKDIKPRPDGVLQMFIQDPDGYFLELTEV